MGFNIEVCFHSPSAHIHQKEILNTVLHVRATLGLTKKLIHRPVCQVDSDFNPPSCTLREQCLQILVVFDLQEQSVQRAANRPPETPAWRKTAQASGPRHKMFLRGSQIMSSCVNNAHKTTMCRIFQSKVLLVYSIDLILKYILNCGFTL